MLSIVVYDVGKEQHIFSQKNILYLPALLPYGVLIHFQGYFYNLKLEAFQLHSCQHQRTKKRDRPDEKA